MTPDVRRYFIGLIAFAFVICWAIAGLLVATAGLALCAAIIFGPELATRRRRPQRQRPVRVRPATEERHSSYQLVPDDPSLVIELG